MSDPATPASDDRPEPGNRASQALPRIRRTRASWYQIPTEERESDGTLEWDHTTLVVVEIEAGDAVGLGYTYAHPAAADLVRRTFAPLIEGASPSAQPALWISMIEASRNIGVAGLVATAISAVDVALWDLRARLLNLSVLDLTGSVREAVPVYGSGGFTSYDEVRLCRQLANWIENGIGSVKMKVGREPKEDSRRVGAARQAIGDVPELMVDANNAYGAKQAVDWAYRFHDEAKVTWLEQPVPHENAAAMCFVREHAPPAVEITDGEYGYGPAWFAKRLEAGAADVFMPDVTRCLGLTGFLRIAALCAAHDVPISSHCAPALHATAGCAVEGLRHCEYFFDHARIEQAVFDGAPPVDAAGCMSPDRTRPGFGLEFKRSAAEQMATARG